MHSCLVHLHFPFFALSFFCAYTSPILFLCFQPLPRCLNEEHKNRQDPCPRFDFEWPLRFNEIDYNEDMDDSTLSLKLMGFVEIEDKQIFLHQESMEVINLGNDEEKKVKINMSLSSSARKEIISLICEYMEFAPSHIRICQGLVKKQ